MRRPCAVTVEDIEDVIIELISDETNESPEKLRGDLEAKGGELPIDSLLTAEVLPAMEQRFGIQLPTDLQTAHNMRSVRRLALQVMDVVEEAARRRGETA
jgi:acyl carrier protein